MDAQAIVGEVAKDVFSQALSLATWFIILYVIWRNRQRVASLLQMFRVKSIEIGDGKVKIERSVELVATAFYEHNLPPPNDEEIRSITSVVTYLAPLVVPSEVLWVDDHPNGNWFENAALQQLGIVVRNVRTTEEALAVLHERGHQIDAIISDWTRTPAHTPEEPEGPRLLRLIRAGGFLQPFIFYAGVVPETELAHRSAVAAQYQAVGVTASPEELMRWLMVALVQRRLIPPRRPQQLKGAATPNV